MIAKSTEPSDVKEVSHANYAVYMIHLPLTWGNYNFFVAVQKAV